MNSFVSFAVCLAAAGCVQNTDVDWQAQQGSSVELPAQQTPTSCQTRYLITIETRIHSVSMDPFKHMRNAANANVLTLPVDKKTYDEYSIGQVLEEKFDGVGLALKGSWGSVKSIVIDKKLSCQ